jgi:hypothetical protein
VERQDEAILVGLSSDDKKRVAAIRKPMLPLDSGAAQEGEGTETAAEARREAALPGFVDGAAQEEENVDGKSASSNDNDDSDGLFVLQPAAAGVFQ